jgi:hypothetical protein
MVVYCFYEWHLYTNILFPYIPNLMVLVDKWRSIDYLISFDYDELMASLIYWILVYRWFCEKFTPGGRIPAGTLENLTLDKEFSVGISTVVMISI